MDTTQFKRQLSDLLTDPREDLNIEAKEWLDPLNDSDRANLAQALLALANHGGGFVIIGFKDNGGQLRPSIPPDGRLIQYSPDTINQIVKKYADPPFQCGIHHVVSPDTGNSHPVIIVPGDHRVPVRAKRDGPNQAHVRLNTYYIRRPGPESSPVQTAQEWDQLIRRCVLADRAALVDSLRAIVTGDLNVKLEADPLEEWVANGEERWKDLVAEETEKNPKLKPLLGGSWTFAYCISDAPRVEPLSRLLTLLREVKGHETGWPPWWVPTREEIAPYSFDGMIECWLRDASDSGHADFWRASSDGRMYLTRGYYEDAEDGALRGKNFDHIIPIWRVGECVLHSARLATALRATDAQINFWSSWRGLAGRTLTSHEASLRVPLMHQYSCRQNTVCTKASGRASDLIPSLPEIVAQLVRPLYQAFGFYNPGDRLIRNELAAMQKGV